MALPGSNRRATARNRINPEHGGMLRPSFDPPPFRAPGPREMTIQWRVTGTGGARTIITTYDVAQQLSTQYGYDTSRFVFSVLSVKVWDFPSQTGIPSFLTITPYDPLDAGKLTTLTDYGTPVRPAAVGYQWPYSMTVRPLKPSLTYNLLDCGCNGTGLVRFTVRLSVVPLDTCPKAPTPSSELELGA